MLESTFSNKFIKIHNRHENNISLNTCPQCCVFLQWTWRWWKRIRELVLKIAGEVEDGEKRLWRMKNIFQNIHPQKNPVNVTCTTKQIKSWRNEDYSFCFEVGVVLDWSPRRLRSLEAFWGLSQIEWSQDKLCLKHTNAHQLLQNESQTPVRIIWLCLWDRDKYSKVL